MAASSRFARSVGDRAVFIQGWSAAWADVEVRTVVARTAEASAASSLRST
jgi:hypothetical protein